MRDDGVQTNAVISSDGLYRYVLTRIWADPTRFPTLSIVMLNPSTADAEVDDPTIRKCMTLAKNWDFAGIKVCNLFAYRSKDPRIIERGPSQGIDVVGPKNDNFIENLARHASFVSRRSAPVLCAWGASEFARERASQVSEIIKRHGHMVCVGTTKSGAPKHPLYVPNASKALAWP